MRSLWVLLAASACVVSTPILATEAPSPCNISNVECLDLYVVDTSIKDVFKAITKLSELRIELSENVRGQVEELILSGSPDAVIDTLAKVMDLDWFEFNGTTYVSRSDDVISRVIRLGNLPFEAALISLNRVGLNTDPMRIAPASAGKAMVMTGPPTMVALGEVVIEGVPDPLKALPPAEKSIRIRRGVQVTAEPVGALLPKQDSANAQQSVAQQSTNALASASK